MFNCNEEGVATTKTLPLDWRSARKKYAGGIKAGLTVFNQPSAASATPTGVKLVVGAPAVIDA